MQIIADLHLHSKYSRAVSPEMLLPKMSWWGKRKGINLLGTGDFTHPLWLREIKANLEEAGEGIYGLRKVDPGDHRDPRDQYHDPSFLLSTEISSIYSQGGKVRRIHNIVLSPSVETVEKINNKLIKRGCNLHSDGRPIIGIPAKDLVKIILEIDSRALIIPAHVWTPWFSVYGSQSGFDSLDECFGEMAKYIYGVETGLSSDPAMNWRISELNHRSILSNSDAHSGPKLGREATVFEMEEVSYENIRKAIMGNETTSKISHTLEFYPEEGKYHYTGHRACNIKQTPEETRRLGEICSVCGKHLTVGVMHRVDKLASQNPKLQMINDQFGVKWISCEDRPPYAMLVPLQEIIAESMGSAPASIKVQSEYNKLVVEQGEFGVLLTMPISEITKIAGEKIAEGVKKVRSGDISVDPGYDGVFGVVKIWTKGSEETKETEGTKEQMSMF